MAKPFSIFFNGNIIDNGTPMPSLSQVEWDQSSDFTSGEDGGPSGQASVDATQMLCSGCVNSFSLGNLTLSINGTADFFGRLNAGNRILVSQAMPLTNTEIYKLALEITFH